MHCVRLHNSNLILHIHKHKHIGIDFFLCTYTKLNFTAMFSAFVLLCFVSRFVEGTSPLCTIVRAKRHVHIERETKKKKNNNTSERNTRSTTVRAWDMRIELIILLESMLLGLYDNYLHWSTLWHFSLKICSEAKKRSKFVRSIENKSSLPIKIIDMYQQKIDFRLF